MPKKKEPDLTPEEQFKRFQEAAKQHEIEKRLPEIEQAFGSLAGGAKDSKVSSEGREEKEA
jgi:hypothetical protein